MGRFGCGLVVGLFMSTAAAAQEPDAARASTMEEIGSCRCPERTLGEYYRGAEEVLLLRIDSVHSRDGGDTVLRGVVVEAPWKVAAGSVAALDETVSYTTAGSSAACGVRAEPGDVLVIFALPDAAGDGLLRVDSCSGTRVYRTATGELQGFHDVPGRFVVRQLDAASGMDALAGAASVVDGSVDAMVGLLDLEPLAHGGNVPILAEPREGAAVLTTVDDHPQVESREVGYEVPAAVVFERREGWSRVRLSDGRGGWISPESSGTWFPYAELPIRRLAYLTPSWSGHVWPEVGAGIPWRSALRSTTAEEVSVEVLESMVLGGVPWFRVHVLAESPCEGGDPRTILSGWVSGYGADGEHTVWYYSRGC